VRSLALVMPGMRPLVLLAALLLACTPTLPQAVSSASPTVEPTVVATATPKPPQPVRARSVAAVGTGFVASGDFTGTKTSQVAFIQDTAADQSVSISVGKGPADPATASLWFKSGPGYLSLARAKLAVMDVDADGKDDLVGLYDSGANTSRIYVFRSTGSTFVPAGAWWSGDLTWARARNLLAGRFSSAEKDALLITYQDDGAQLRILDFEPSGDKFIASDAAYISGKGQWDLSKAKFAVGRFTRATGADQLVAMYPSGTRAKLQLFEPGAKGLAYQPGVYETDADYDVSHVTLAAADVNADGQDDLVALYVDADGGARIHVFDPAASWKPVNGLSGMAALPAGALCASMGGLIVGDWDSDGRADALALAPSGLNATRMHRLASSGTTLTVSSGAEPLSCPVWPLNGMPANGANTTIRPLYVKVDNNPSARPHYGIAKADQVYEWLVEGLTTRLAAVFQSQTPDVIGSVRSARMTDRPILPSLGAAFVYSGGGPEELMAIHFDEAVGHRYVDISPNYGWGYRVEFRHAPYNYFTTYGALKAALAAAPDGDQPALIAPWSFLPTATGDPLAGGFAGSVPATSITIPYRAGFAVGYTYTPATRSYARTQDGEREVDGATGQVIAAKDVVVILTEVHFTEAFGLDPAGNPKLDMTLTGTGKGIIFRDGLRQDVTWTRPDIVDAFTFRNASGEVVQLSPGQPWIHIVPQDWIIPSK
jgi:hypothetical protein